MSLFNNSKSTGDFPEQHAESNSDQFHRIAFDLAPVAIAFVGLDARFIKVNQSLCALTGYAADELCGMAVADLTHIDDRDRDAGLVQSYFSQGGDAVYENEKRYVRKDGGVRWVSITARIVKDANGRPIHSIAVIRDISDRKAAEAALQDSEAFNRSIAETSPDCLKVMDTKGRIEYINSNGCELLEIDDFQKLQGREWSEFWPAQSRDQIVNAVGSARSGASSHFVAFCPTLKGTPKWWDVTVNPALDLQGRCIRIVASSRDVTQRKQDEQALRESEERFRAAVGIVSSIIWTNDAEGKMKGLQSSWGNFTGQAEAEYQDYGWVNAVHPDDSLPTIAAWEVAVANKSLFEFEHRVRRRDGKWRSCSIRAVPVLCDDGTIREWVGVHTDNTEQKEAEVKIRLLMAEVTHRSKNLLGVVQAIARQTGYHGDAATFVNRLTDRIQGLSASQDLIVKNDWFSVEIADLAQGQLAHFRELTGSRIAADGPSVHLSPAAAQAIGMALHELATNAAKYGALSNEAGRVRLVWDVTDAEVPDFTIQWIEEGGPPVVLPSRLGFGNVVMVRMAEAAVNGSVDLDYNIQGLSWKLVTPLTNLLKTTPNN